MFLIIKLSHLSTLIKKTKGTSTLKLNKQKITTTLYIKLGQRRL